MTESKVSLTPEIRNLINDMANSFEAVPSLGVPFIKDCLVLSAALGPRQLGDALLHRQVAAKLWRLEGEKKEAAEGSEYRSAAVLHFALGEAPEALWTQVRWLCPACYFFLIASLAVFFIINYSCEFACAARTDHR